MGRHPSAIVQSDRIAGDAEIGPFCVIGPCVSVGAGARLHSHVVASGEVEIGPGTEVFEGAVLGKAMARHPTIRRPVGAPGALRIGSACSVGSHAVLYQNVVVGDGSLVGDHASVLEGAVIGQAAVIGRSVTMHPDTRIGDRSRVLDHSHIATAAVVGCDCVVSLLLAEVAGARPLASRRVVVEGTRLPGAQRAARAAFELADRAAHWRRSRRS